MRNFKLKYLVDKNRIKSVVINREFPDKKSLAQFIILYAQSFMNLEALTKKEHHFLLVTMFMQLRGIDIGDSKAVNIYKNDYGYKTKRTIYDYRSALVKKDFLIRDKDGYVALPRMFDLKSFGEDVDLVVGFKKVTDEIVRQN